MHVGALRSLESGSLYRVHGALSTAAVLPIRGRLPDLVNAVTSRLGAMGFRPIYLVTPDLSVPTGEAFTAIARWAGTSKTTLDAPDLTLARADLVEEPPETIFREPEHLPDLDRDLSYEEQRTIRYALAHDDNPKHLTGLAWTLEPDFPVASSLLRAKARLSELRTAAPAVKDEARARRDNALRAMLGRAYAEAGWRLGWDPIARLESPIAWILGATKTLGDGVTSGFAKYDGVVESLGGQIPIRQMRVLEEAIRAARAKPNAASFAIGFPLEVLMASPSSPEIEAARVLASNAFRELERFAEGQTLEERAELFLHALKEASGTRDVRAVLLDRIREKIKTTDDAVSIKAAIVKLLEASPDGFARSPHAIAADLDVSPDVAHAAIAAIEELPGGLRIVRPDVLMAIDPANLSQVERPAGAMPESPFAGANRKGPSTGALQLAYSLARPEISRVRSPAAAQKRVALTNRAANRGHAEAKIAQEALEQARKILQRRKWIEWYKRIERAKP